MYIWGREREKYERNNKTKIIQEKNPYYIYTTYLIHGVEDARRDLGDGECLAADALDQPLRAPRHPRVDEQDPQVLGRRPAGHGRLGAVRDHAAVRAHRVVDPCRKNTFSRVRPAYIWSTDVRSFQTCGQPWIGPNQFQIYCTESAIWSKTYVR